MPKMHSKILRAAIIVLCILVLSASIELLFFNYHAIRYSDRLEIDAQDMLSDANGFIREGDALVPTQDNASISYQFADNYYSKLIIDYTSADDNTMIMSLGSFDSSGKDTLLTVSDTYNHQLTSAVTNIDQHIHSINIVFPTASISVNHISLVNEIQFNALRFLFMTVAGLLFAFIIFSKKIMGERIELAFLITALTIGILMIILIPLKNPVTWDDDTHFQRVYEQSFLSEVKWTQAAYDYEKRLVPEANTIEEREAVIKLLNSENDFDNPVSVKAKSNYIPYTLRCYIPQSAMTALSRGLDLSFTATQAAARMGGFLVYVLAIYAAISMAKFGKRMIAAIALMPTPLFIAANFSYDQVVIAFVILAFTAFTVEYFDRDHKLSLKNTAIFLAAMIIACSTKAVYVPLVLLLLLLPEEKFRSRKNMYWFRIGILGIFLTIMATFVLPTVINPSSTGDLRGGDTSVAGQLHFILSDPLFYTRLLLQSIWDNLGSFFLGRTSYVNFAYLGLQDNNTGYIAIIVILLALFTDAGKDDTYIFKRSSKICIYFLLFTTICLVWTALYIAFTPVGAAEILGVQSRYYIPLAVPLMFMLRNPKIASNISPIILNRIVFAGCTFIGLYSIYGLILKPFNF